MPKQYQLTYFNAKARAETTRLMFAAAGQEFEDIRIEFADWAQKKKDTPQGSLPYMVIDGTITVSQSMAINRYIARELSMYGANSLEALYIDEIADTAVDLFEEGGKVFFNQDLKEPFLKEIAPRLLGYIEKSIESRAEKGKSPGFAVGSKLSLADIMIFNAVDFGNLQEALSKYPRIKASVEKVMADKGIAAWLKTRS